MENSEKRTITPEVKEALEILAKRLPQVKVKPNPKNRFKQTINQKKGSSVTTGTIVVPKDSEGIPLYTTMLGQAMIDNNISFKDGETIKPNKKYTLQVGFVMVNHYKELEKAWLQEGSIGTSKYIEKIYSQVKNEATS